MTSLPPGLILVVGALLLPLLPGILRKVVALALPAIGFFLVTQLPEGHTLTMSLFGYDLTPLRVDRLSLIFGYIFHIAAFLSVIYALHVDDTLQQVAGLSYAGAAIGAAFAGDLMTLFVYWELTAITSVFLIWAKRTERSYTTGLRYMIIQVGSGVLLLAGAGLYYRESGSLEFGAMTLGSTGTWLIFLAFGIKAAFPLLHTWLEDAYPEATITGTVWLSAFTTKLAIYALARGFAGTEILVPIGATMTAFPIFFAVIENDLRRVLAYSLNNQLGYMVVGIGIGTPLAIDGACAHAFAHILYKGLLFMTMGAVLLRAGTCKGSDLGGLYRSMPWTTTFCIIGGASISAFPLTSGFVSKSLILTAAADGHYTVTFLILLFASAGVFHHSGIKIPYFAFFAHDSGIRCKEAPKNMLVAMGIASLFCIGLGVLPGYLYELLPSRTDYPAYTTTHVVTQLQLLLYSALAFGWLMRTGLYPPELRSVNLDVDWFYRRTLPAAGRFVASAAGNAKTFATNLAVATLSAVFAPVRHFYGPAGVLARTTSTGASVMWAVILLAVYLLVYYLRS